MPTSNSRRTRLLRLATWVAFVLGAAIGYGFRNSMIGVLGGVVWLIAFIGILTIPIFKRRGSESQTTS